MLYDAINRENRKTPSLVVHIHLVFLICSDQFRFKDRIIIFDFKNIENRISEAIFDAFFTEMLE